MTASIFSHLPNILIMNIIKMNTESCRIEKEIALTKEKMNTCFPFIENNELYGWDTTKGETPFDNINFEGHWDNALRLNKGKHYIFYSHYICGIFFILI